MKRILALTLTLVMALAAFSGCAMFENSVQASCLTEESGKYSLTLPKSGDKIELSAEEAEFVPYITDALVEKAEDKITKDVAEFSRHSDFYLQITEDYLCLTVEVVENIDRPSSPETSGGYADGGCGIDHEHVFYSERISSRAVFAPYENSHINFSDESLRKTVTYFSKYLDDVNFVAGLSQADFMSQMGKYSYNGKVVTDIAKGFHYDGRYGGGLELGNELFGFYNDYKVTEDEKYANYTNGLHTKVQLKGLDLPYGIKLGSSIKDAFKNIGIESAPYSDFTPDKNSDTDMTLYNDGNSSIVFQNLKLAKEPADYELPYVLSYTETYGVQQHGVKATTVERKIKFSFDESASNALGQVEISVTERRTLK